MMRPYVLDDVKNSILAFREHGTLNRVSFVLLNCFKAFDAETKNSAEAS